MKSDRETDQAGRPLTDALAAQAGRVSFHMPGHRGGRVFPDMPPFNPALLDTTELQGTGDLAEPATHVRDAFRLASAFFGSGESWFITSGTSTSLFIMMATALREGDRVILPRAVHLAVVHAVAILGLEPLFVRPVSGTSFPDGQPDAASFLEAISRFPDARACLLTRPDYFGRAPDIEPIAREAHRRSMLLLVDEAHGAHWAAAPDLLPATALSLGADLVCQSAHKTLPALTPASLLHLSGEALEAGRLDRTRLAAMVKVFQTSSPSFLIAASIDTARARLALEGRKALERLVDLNDRLCADLPSHYRRILPPGADPSRLVIDFSGTGRDRLAFWSHLDRLGIDAELVDLTRAVLIPGLDQAAEDYERLKEALVSFPCELSAVRRSGHLARMETLASRRDTLLSADAAFVVPPRQALLGRTEASGVADRVIAPYPPGLPIVWPGEVLSAGHRDYLADLLAEGVSVRGIKA